MMLEWLNEAEVLAITDDEAVVAVEKKLSVYNGVHGVHWVISSAEVLILTERVIEGVSVIFESSRSILQILNDPDEFFNGVVKVEADLVGASLNSFVTSELELFDEHFVRSLSEAAAFISIEVDVVYEERCLEVTYRVCGSHFRFSSELDVDADFVVLKSDERESESWVTVKEEDERDIELTTSESGCTIILCYHLLVAITLFLRSGKFGPDFEPVGVMLINLLTTDVEFNFFQETVTSRVDISFTRSEVWESCFNPAISDEVTIAADISGSFTAEVSVTVKGLFYRFASEVSVTAVDYFEESDLWVTSEVNILSAVSDELHETTTHIYVK
mgnify:CR=1 FL=1